MCRTAFISQHKLTCLNLTKSVNLVVVLLQCVRYSVMAGTADKILEHLLETRIGKECDSTGI